MKKNTHKSIYSHARVYGNESMLTASYTRLPKMLDVLDAITKPNRVLDLGCGTGYFASLIRERFPTTYITGMDVSKEALKIAKQKYKDITFICADSEKPFPIDSSSIDLVVSGEHIEHLRDVDIYLEEINRVLKKGGTLLLTTPNLASWINRLFLLVGKQPWYLDPSLRVSLPIFTVGRYTFPDSLTTPPAGHLRLYTLDALTKLLGAYGFSIASVKGASILVKPIVKQLDSAFSFFPGLAFGFIVRAEKV